MESTTMMVAEEGSSCSVPDITSMDTTKEDYASSSSAGIYNNTLPSSSLSELLLPEQDDDDKIDDDPFNVFVSSLHRRKNAGVARSASPRSESERDSQRLVDLLDALTNLVTEGKVLPDEKHESLKQVIRLLSLQQGEDADDMAFYVNEALKACAPKTTSAQDKHQTENEQDRLIVRDDDPSNNAVSQTPATHKTTLQKAQSSRTAFSFAKQFSFRRKPEESNSSNTAVTLENATGTSSSQAPTTKKPSSTTTAAASTSVKQTLQKSQSSRMINMPFAKQFSFRKAIVKDPTTTNTTKVDTKKTTRPSLASSKAQSSRGGFSFMMKQMSFRNNTSSKNTKKEEKMKRAASSKDLVSSSSSSSSSQRVTTTNMSKQTSLRQKNSNNENNKSVRSHSRTSNEEKPLSACPRRPSNEENPRSPRRPSNEGNPCSPRRPSNEENPCSPRRHSNDGPSRSPRRPSNEENPRSSRRPSNEENPRSPRRPSNEENPRSPRRPSNDESRPGSKRSSGGKLRRPSNEGTCARRPSNDGELRPKTRQSSYDSNEETHVGSTSRLKYGELRTEAEELTPPPPSSSRRSKKSRDALSASNHEGKRTRFSDLRKAQSSRTGMALSKEASFRGASRSREFQTPKSGMRRVLSQKDIMASPYTVSEPQTPRGMHKSPSLRSRRLVQQQSFRKKPGESPRKEMKQRKASRDSSLAHSNHETRRPRPDLLRKAPSLRNRDQLSGSSYHDSSRDKTKYMVKSQSARTGLSFAQQSSFRKRSSKKPGSVDEIQPKSNGSHHSKSSLSVSNHEQRRPRHMLLEKSQSTRSSLAMIKQVSLRNIKKMWTRNPSPKDTFLEENTAGSDESQDPVQTGNSTEQAPFKVEVSESSVTETPMRKPLKMRSRRDIVKSPRGLPIMENGPIPAQSPHSRGMRRRKSADGCGRTASPRRSPRRRKMLVHPCAKPIAGPSAVDPARAGDVRTLLEGKTSTRVEEGRENAPETPGSCAKFNDSEFSSVSPDRAPASEGDDVGSVCSSESESSGVSFGEEEPLAACSPKPLSALDPVTVVKVNVKDHQEEIIQDDVSVYSTSSDESEDSSLASGNSAGSFSSSRIFTTSSSRIGLVRQDSGRPNLIPMTSVDISECQRSSSTLHQSLTSSCPSLTLCLDTGKEAAGAPRQPRRELSDHERERSMAPVPALVSLCSASTKEAAEAPRPPRRERTDHKRDIDAGADSRTDFMDSENEASGAPQPPRREQTDHKREMATDDDFSLSPSQALAENLTTSVDVSPQRPLRDYSRHDRDLDSKLAAKNVCSSAPNTEKNVSHDRALQQVLYTADSIIASGFLSPRKKSSAGCFHDSFVTPVPARRGIARNDRALSVKDFRTLSSKAWSSRSMKDLTTTPMSLQQMMIDAPISSIHVRVGSTGNDDSFSSIGSRGFEEDDGDSAHCSYGPLVAQQQGWLDFGKSPSVAPQQPKRESTAHKRELVESTSKVDLDLSPRKPMRETTKHKRNLKANAPGVASSP